jgi:hypothetical protein
LVLHVILVAADDYDDPDLWYLYEYHLCLFISLVLIIMILIPIQYSDDRKWLIVSYPCIVDNMYDTPVIREIAVLPPYGINNCEQQISHVSLVISINYIELIKD